MLKVYRKGIDVGIAELPLKGCSIKRSIMGVDEVQADVTVSAVLDIKVGDFVRVGDVDYSLNRMGDFEKLSDVEYRYNFIFESPLYNLLDKLYMHPLSNQSKFYLTGTLRDFLDLLVQNVNLTSNVAGTDNGWSVGSVVDTERKNLLFGSISCREVLNMLANEFSVEYFIGTVAGVGDMRTIHFVDKVERMTSIQLEQGKGKGLYKISRKNVDSDNTVTRAYLFGGTRNLPPAYGGKPAYRNGEEHLRIEEKYIEDFSEYTKIVERDVFFDDIYPHFEGSVSGVSGENATLVTSLSIDFDVEKQKIGDGSRVSFLTGDLMGIDFQFNYNHSNKQLQLIRKEDERHPDGNRPLIPSGLVKPNVGDKFTFTEIVMPDAYVQKAESDLRVKGANWLGYYKQLRVKFDLDIDHRWLSKRAIELGDVVRVLIPQEGIDKQVRIITIDKQLESGKVNCELSNYIVESWQKQLDGRIQQVSNSIEHSRTEVLYDIDASKDWTARNFARLYGGNSFVGDQAVDGCLDALAGDFDELKAKDVTVLGLAKLLNLDVSGLAGLAQAVIGNYISSKKFVPGFSGEGFKIWESVAGNWHGELDTLTVRKTMSIFELIIQKIRAVNGAWAITQASGKVKGVVDNGNTYTIELDGDMGFVIGDLVRCQNWTGTNVKYYWVAVTSVLGKTFVANKSEFGGVVPSEGDEVVQMGNLSNTARQGMIYMSAAEDGRPVIDVLNGINSKTFAGKVKCRLGSLNGITDETYGALSGYGLYAENVFIKGKIVTTGGNVATIASVDALGDKVVAAKKVADDAAIKAGDAERELLAANKRLDDISSDNKFTPDEKYTVKLEWDTIAAEYGKNITQANGFSIPITAYVSAYNALSAYITPLLASLLSTDVIVGSTFRTNFVNYYNAKTDLLNAVATKAKQLADAAKGVADTAKISADAAKGVADAAKISADAASVRLNDWASDGLVSPTEKLGLRQQQADIQAEYKEIQAQVTRYGLLLSAEWVGYNSAYSLANAALGKYTAVSPESIIVGSDWGNIGGYYAKRQLVLDKIAVGAKDWVGTVVDNIVIGGRNLAKNSISYVGWITNLSPSEIDASTSIVTMRSTGLEKYIHIQSGTVMGVAGQAYTASYKVKCENLDKGTTIPIFYDGKWQSYNYKEIKNTNDQWVLISNTFTPTTNGTICFAIDNFKNTTGLIYAKEGKLEAGNKPTDWSPAPEDVDSAVLAAQTAANNAQSAATTAGNNATTANNALADIANDNKLTPTEKQRTKLEWDAIVGEKAKIEAEADVYGQSKTAYQTAYNALSTYITPLLASLSTTTAIVGTTFRANFVNYYNARQDLLNVIHTRAKQLADAAQTTGNNAQTAANNAQTAANNAQTAANTAGSNATTANNALADIANDNKLTPTEKQRTKLEWDAIVGEKAKIEAEADVYGQSKTAYQTAYNALSTYITPLLASLSTTTAIVGTTFRANFVNYYNARQDLLNVIHTRAKQLADAAQTTGTNAQTAANNAQSAATTAGNNATTANNALADIANDNKLTPTEKQRTKLEWDAIVGEKAKIEAEADVYGQSKTAYQTAYNALSTYITPLLASLSTTTAIVGTTFRANFVNYYNARQDLLNVIHTRAKQLADAAQTTGTNAQTAANNAQSAATTAGNNATTANNALADIANDNKLTPTEKQRTKLEWDAIVGEKAKIEAEADVYGQSKTAYQTAYNALSTYITPLLASLSTTTAIVGTTFRANFVNYYNARQDLLNVIHTRAKQLADAAQTTGTNAQTAANNAQSAATTAGNNATTANNALADIANDNKLTPTEKQRTKLEWDAIVGEKAKIEAEADVYGQSKTAYQAAYNALSTYITPLLASLSTTTAIVGTTFRANFVNYYNARQDLLNVIHTRAKQLADAATVTADAKAYQGGRMLYRDPEFRAGVNGLAIYNNAANGNTYYARIGKPADCPTGSTHCLQVSNKGAANPALGGVYWGTQTRANAKYISRIVAKIPVGYTLNYATNAIGDGGWQKWGTPVLGTGRYEEYLCIVQNGISGSFSSTNFFYINGAVGTATAPVNWFIAYATVFDVTQAEIDYPTDAQARANALANKLGSLAYDSIVEKAKLGTTVIEGGMIRSDIINVGAIKVSGAFATTADVNTAKAGAISSAATDAQTRASTAQTNAINDAQAKINAVEIGGRNIFRTSGNFGSVVSNWGNNGGGLAIDTSVLYMGFNTVKTTVGTGIYGNWYRLEAGVEYTYSAMIKSNESYTGNYNIPLHYHAGLNNAQQGKITVTKYDTSFIAGVWKLAYITFKLTGDGNSFRPFIYVGSGTRIFNIAWLKLEKGNKATDWSPAPEDVDADATTKVTTLKNSLKGLAYQDKISSALCDTTLIVGGYLKTTLIDVAYLKAQVISADYISGLACNFTKGTIGGFTITANSIYAQADVTTYDVNGNTVTTKQTMTLTPTMLMLSNNNGYAGMSQISSEGIWASKAGQKNASKNGREIRSAIMGWGRGLLNGGSYRALVGIFGTIDPDPKTDLSAPSFGGYFDKLFAAGLYFNVRRIDAFSFSTIELNDYDVYVSCAQQFSITLKLPPKPNVGQIVFVRRMYNYNINILGNGMQISSQNGGIGTSLLMGGDALYGSTAMLVFDGGCWCWSYMNK